MSILIAARDEETTIGPCLQAISRLHYPTDAFEVLVGNDASSDQTGLVVAGFALRLPNVRLVEIERPVAGLLGKANVLAQLARRARGQYLFFTDADTEVPEGWIRELMAGHSQRVPLGIVTGVTLPEGSELFHKLQTIDWLYNLTLTHLLSRAGIPVTAMGNNMVVSRGAYEAVGGYESLPFSVVEDYALFRAIVQKGYNFSNPLDASVLARTKPVDTLRAFLHQRKRWMRGATDLPTWMVILLYAQYLTGPLLLLLGWFAPGPALGLYLLRLLIQTLTLSFGIQRLGQTKLWPYALLFEPYQLLIGLLSVAFYWLPVRLEWKGRRYD